MCSPGPEDSECGGPQGPRGIPGCSQDAPTPDDGRSQHLHGYRVHTPVQDQVRSPPTQNNSALSALWCYKLYLQTISTPF